jgi:hypothetical protein
LTHTCYLYRICQDHTSALRMLGDAFASPEPAWRAYQVMVRAAIALMATARVAEVQRIYAEGLAADVGAANPYYGQLVNAAVWRFGYRKMLDEKMANSPAERAWLARYN